MNDKVTYFLNIFSSVSKINPYFPKNLCFYFDTKLKTNVCFQLFLVEGSKGTVPYFKTASPVVYYWNIGNVRWSPSWTIHKCCLCLFHR